MQWKHAMALSVLNKSLNLTNTEYWAQRDCNVIKSPLIVKVIKGH